MADIEFKGLDKVYPGDVYAVRSLDLTVADGELLVLLGPSGCGKSTILRLLAGLEQPTDGEIHLAGRRVDHLPPRDRDVALVFQNYALYPHMTVRDNLVFPLRMQRVPAEERSQRVAEIADMLGLGEVLDKKPRTLSGGQQQRVAMGRALVRHPAAFLMDEPLSNLDARLRNRLRAEIARLQRGLGVTTLYVTHDQVEAMTLGHRVAVLRDGRLQQLGNPQRLYDYPANVFVAAFLGQPGMNLLTGTLEGRDGAYAVNLGGPTVPVPAEIVANAPKLESLLGERVQVGIRPEALRFSSPSADCQAPVTVTSVEALGNEYVVLGETSLPVYASAGGKGGAGAERDAPGADTLAVRVPADAAVPQPDDRLHLDLAAHRVSVFDQAGRSVDERSS
jgi:multiple sugar transport system ATP-binding protein